MYGVEETYNMIITIGKLVGKLVTGQFSIDALSGPVGIYKTTETVVTFGLYNILYFAAMLSVNLGIMNLLPLPALDGGRLLFFAVGNSKRKTDRPSKRRYGSLRRNPPPDDLNGRRDME